MKVSICENLGDVDAKNWNALNRDGSPFLRHEFLHAMELHDCVGENFGWYPRHVLIHDNNHRLLAAQPLYVKTNSYGEFVFDWSWADAWERAGGRYYPKLVSSIPYTPATGQRFLLAPDAPRELANQLVQATLKEARDLGVSSMHWLFPDTHDRDVLREEGLLERVGIQYHWRNAGWETMDDFVAALNARKRKKLNRERRRVEEAGIGMEVVHGHEATAEHWKKISEFYASTFYFKGGTPTFNQAFFEHIGRTMGEQLVMVFARDQGKLVAGAINYRSNHALYGRHWGCDEHYDSLHFEVCYYQGIEYCLREGLKLFEPGAQGEYKISRGFMPAMTYSAHWISHEGFSEHIARYLKNETGLMQEHFEDLTDMSPFRKTDD